MADLEFSVTLPVFDSLGTGIPPVTESARRAEALGFDAVWAGDHLFFHQPNHECLVSIAMALAATDTLRVGSGVLLPALREPVTLVKQVLTLSLLSEGRFVMGVGVGGEYGSEWDAVGVDPRERGRRTDDFLEYYRACLIGEPVDFAGRTFEVSSPAMLPVPDASSAPPVWVGGRSDRALRRAVEHGDGWLSVWNSPSRVREAVETLDRFAAEAGRADRPRIGMVVFVNVGEPATAETEAEAFVNGHYDLPYDRMSKWFAVGPEEVVAERLSALVDVGVGNLMVYPAAADPTTQYEAVARIRDELVSA